MITSRPWSLYSRLLLCLLLIPFYSGCVIIDFMLIVHWRLIRFLMSLFVRTSDVCSIYPMDDSFYVSFLITCVSMAFSSDWRIMWYLCVHSHIANSMCLCEIAAMLKWRDWIRIVKASYTAVHMCWFIYGPTGIASLTAIPVGGLNLFFSEVGLYQSCIALLFIRPLPSNDANWDITVIRIDDVIPVLSLMLVRLRTV